MIPRILFYKHTIQNTSVSTLIVDKRCHYIKSSRILLQITNIVKNITGLGFTGDEIVNHLISFSIAMAL